MHAIVRLKSNHCGIVPPPHVCCPVVDDKVWSGCFERDDSVCDKVRRSSDFAFHQVFNSDT